MYSELSIFEKNNSFNLCESYIYFIDLYVLKLNHQTYREQQCYCQCYNNVIVKVTLITEPFHMYLLFHRLLQKTYISDLYTQRLITDTSNLISNMIFHSSVTVVLIYIVHILIFPFI